VFDSSHLARNQPLSFRNPPEHHPQRDYFRQGITNIFTKTLNLRRLGTDTSSQLFLTHKEMIQKQDTRLSLISCDLYDGGYEEKAGQGQPKNMIPWDKLAEFFKTYLT
jgi:hypothetical protein